MSERSRSTIIATAVLALAAVVAFATSTLAVSATRSAKPTRPLGFQPFLGFRLTGQVKTANPSAPRSFSLSFTPSFTLGNDSNGIVRDSVPPTLDDVYIEQDTAYPVPGGRIQVVGPVALPFAQETLSVVVQIKGDCFPLQRGNTFAFVGTPADCAAAFLVLQGQAYDVSSLLSSLSGNFTATDDTRTQWKGSLTGRFSNPGYTFPVAALGPAAGSILQIGDDRGQLGTAKVTFQG